jgi:ABC-2 type transport system ATP-binding protein
MIDVFEVTKRYGATLALDNISFSVEPGRVTGFLGPNGAGKSTAMRLMIGLDEPDDGSALINGMPYRNLSQPLRQAGALLDGRGFHAGRSAYNHLLALATTHGIAKSRIDEVLELTGLSDVAHRRPGTYSLGMGQRLGLAAAMLGDPPVLLLDEPMNGLDPDGMNWMRRLLPELASEGRTVLVSSHLMSEMAQIADHLIVIGRGRLVADTSVPDFVARARGIRVRVRASDPANLAAVLKSHSHTVEFEPDDEAIVATGIELNQVGVLASVNGITVYELTAEHPSLESAFLQLTSDDIQYSGRSS